MQSDQSPLQQNLTQQTPELTESVEERTRRLREEYQIEQTLRKVTEPDGDDGAADGEEVWDCDHGCGFSHADYAVAEAHELSCSGPAVASEAGACGVEQGPFVTVSSWQTVVRVAEQIVGSCHECPLEILDDE